MVVQRLLAGTTLWYGNCGSLRCIDSVVLCYVPLRLRSPLCNLRRQNLSFMSLRQHFLQVQVPVCCCWWHTDMSCHTHVSLLLSLSPLFALAHVCDIWLISASLIIVTVCAVITVWQFSLVVVLARMCVLCVLCVCLSSVIRAIPRSEMDLCSVRELEGNWFTVSEGNFWEYTHKHTHTPSPHLKCNLTLVSINRDRNK